MKKFFARTGAGIGVLVLLIILSSIPAFVIMLALGSAHDQWPVIPALGFWTTYSILTGLGCLVRYLPAARDAKVEEND